MKITIIVMVLLSLLLFVFTFYKKTGAGESQDKENAEMSLNEWVKNRGVGKIKGLYQEDIHIGKDVSINTFVKALDFIDQQLGKQKFENVDHNLQTLIWWWGRVTEIDVVKKLKQNAYPVLNRIFKKYMNALRDKTYTPVHDQEIELNMMSLFAEFGDKEGIRQTVQLAKEGYRNDNYYWASIFSERKFLATDVIIEEMGDFFPTGTIGTSYHDMCNRLVLENDIPTHKHPYRSGAGIKRLEEYLDQGTDNDDIENRLKGCNAVNAAVTLSFLDSEDCERLLPKALNHHDTDVQLEAAWSGGKHGNKKCIDRLIELSRDWRCSRTAVQYFRELEIEHMIPKEALYPEFVAKSEMASWLAHPMEYGKFPDELEQVDARELYWPPMKEKRPMFIFRYVYKKHNEDGTDLIDIGVVGSTTFSLFSIDLAQSTPEEIYAVYCAWELDEKDYRNSEIGMKILKQHNPEF